MRKTAVRSFIRSGFITLSFLLLSFGNCFAAAECQQLDLGCAMRVGGALLKMNGLNDWTAPYKLQVLHLYQKINPNATYDDLVKIKAFVDTEFDKYKGQGSINYETIIQIANDIKNQTDPPIPGATQLVLEMEKSITGIIAKSSTTIENYRQSINAWTTSQAAYANNVLLEVDSYCKDNVETCNNLNAVSAPIIGVVMGTSTPVDVIKSIPALQSDPLLGPIANAVDSNGNWKLDTAGTVNLLSDVYSGLRTMNAKNLSFLTNTIDAHQENSQNDTTDYLQAVTGALFDQRLNDAGMAALEALTDKQSLDTAQTAVNVVSMVVGNVLGDSQLASQISTYGGAAIKVASALSGFMDASSGMGAIGLGMDVLGLGGSDEAKMLGLAANVACGNYVGAAMAVFDMFGGGGDGPDPAIMQGIADIRNDIKNLSIQMNGRFDRIDSKLNDIMNTLNTNFDKINVQLGTITGDLATIKTQLSDLQQQMSKMEMRIMASLQDTQIQDLNANINSAFNYNAAMPYSTWNSMNGWFYTYNQTTASNSTFSNQASPSIVDAELYTWLNSDSIDANINKLAKYPILKWGLSFTPPLLPASGNIPNPVVWSKSAEAFLELSKRQPWYAAADDNNASKWLSNVITEGEKIKRVATAISHNEQGIIGKLIQPSTSTTPGLYDGKGKQLLDIVANQETLFYQNNSATLGSGTSKIDLWGAVSQSTSYFPEITISGNSGGTFHFSSNIYQLFNLPDVLRLSQMLNNKNKLSILVRQEPENWGSDIDFDWGDWRVTIELSYNSKIIKSYTMIYGSFYVCGECGERPPNFYADVVASFNNSVIPSFITGSTEINTAEILNNYNQAINIEAPRDIEVELATHQKNYYQQLIENLPTTQLNCSEYLGAKQLLQSYLSLGFDRSLQQNDYLKYLVYGNDDGTVCNGNSPVSTNSFYTHIQNNITKLITTNQPQPKLDLATPFYKRNDALAGQLTDIAAAINAGTYTEFQSSIDATLNKLSLRANTLKTLAYNDFYRATPGHPLTVAAPGILANDVQQNGITLRGIIQSLPTNGTLTVNGVPATIGTSFDGGFIYTANAGYSGPDTFSYAAEGKRPAGEGFVFTSDPATVTIMVNSGSPTVGLLTPATLFSSAEINQTLTATYHDPDGATTLTNAYVLVAPSANTLNGVILAKYDRVANLLYLYGDAGTTTVSGSCAPGAASTLQNSQAILDCSKTGVVTSGNDLTVTWGITPKIAFASINDRQVFLKADDITAASSGFIQKGHWTITSQPQISLRVNVNGTGGSISQPLFANGVITFTINVEAGYRLSSLMDNGVSAASLLNGSTVTIAATTSPHDIVLTFAPNMLSVTTLGNGSGAVTSSPAGISCSSGSAAGCSAPFPFGTLVSLTATPLPGSLFEGWSGACSGSGVCQVSIDGSGSVTATFTHPPLNAACGSSNGTIVPVAPVANLCLTGTPSSVTGSGPWNWICTGEYGGSFAVCAANPPVLPRSGQTLCHDASGAALPSCSATGQDGELQMGARWPIPRYSDNQNQTVTDTLTGLIWMKNGNHPGTAMTWTQAMAYVQALNSANNGVGTDGHNDWRLPNVNELASLINRQQGVTNSYLNGQGFSSVQPDGYWSSSSAASDPASAWFVNLGDGSTYYWFKSDTFFVWPVRGGASGEYGTTPVTIPRTGQSACFAENGQTMTCAGSGQDGSLRIGAPWPALRFKDNLNQSMTDTLTGLVWATDGNAPGPVECAPGSQKNWSDALNYTACLNRNSYLGKNDWRLPNSSELASLINYQESDNSSWLGSHGFSNLYQDVYWTATTHAGYPGYAWYIYLTDGATGGNEKNTNARVWPVRGGLSTRAVMVATPTDINFGPLPVYGSHSQTIAITNNAPAGSEPLAITSFALSGSYSNQFSITTGDGSNGSCGTTPTLSAGASCTVAVNFAPTEGGAKSATLVVNGNNSLPARLEVALSGSGAFNVTPTLFGGNGVISPASRIMVNGGATATFTLAPAATYRPSSTVTGTCPTGSWNGNQYTTGNITGSCTVGFSFMKVLVLTGLPANAIYGQTGIVATVTGGSGTGTVSYSHGTSTACQVNSATGEVTITSGTGSCIITSTKAASGTFSENNSVPVSITIAQASQTITFDSIAAGTYGDAPITLTAIGGASGIPVTFSIVSGPGTLSGTNNSTLTITGAGTVQIAANQTGNTNYAAATPVNQNLTVNKATATVSLSNLDQTYDGTEKTAAITTIPVGLNVTITYNSLPTAPAATGSYSVTAVINDTNYQGSSSGTLVINPALHTLTVAVSGNGTGTITSTPTGISCTGANCTGSLVGTVTLYATPSILSKFAGWGGVCSGTAASCTVNMDADTIVTATFNLAPLVQIGTTAYTTVQEAYNSAVSNDVIQMLMNPTTALGTLTADRPITIKLKGGYDDAYSATITGSTTITSTVTIKQGKVIMDRIVVK